MKKAVAVVLILAMLVGIAVAGCGSNNASSGDLIPVRAAFHPNLGPLTVPGIDAAMGFFAEEGLDVEWLRFTAGPPAIAAMHSGDLHFSYIGHGALALCAQGEAEVISLSHYTNSEAILVRASSGIQTMHDLVGRTIATEIGTSADVLLDLAATRYDIDPDDINVINMPIPNAISAFIGGSVDAVLVWGADIVSVKNIIGDDIHTVIQTADFMDVVPFIGSWITVNAFIEENRDVVLAFIRALNRVNEFRYNNLDESIQMAADFAEAMDLAVGFDELYSEKEYLIFFSHADWIRMLEDGTAERDYQLQLDYKINSGRIEEGNIFDYVRFDLMREALE